MNTQHCAHTLSFVWRSDDISPSVVDTSRRASVGAIFEVSNGAQAAQAIRAAGAIDVKVPLEFFMGPDCEAFVRKAGVKTVWVEYHSAFACCSADAFLDRLGAQSALCDCIPISGDLDFLTRAVTADTPPRSIGLKGAEGAGFVSRETINVLYATLKEMAAPLKQAPGLIIWGGIAAPEAAAAFVSTGAEGIVFESLHWQTDQVTIDPDLKKRLSKLRPEHTTLVGQSLDTPCRFFDKGNSLAVKELRHYAESHFGCDVSEEDRNAFARKVRDTAVSALDSSLGRQDLVFLGPESTFADTFSQRFGRETEQALTAFSREVARVCRNAPQKQAVFVKSAAAGELGTEFPFLQGAMTWISDRPDFARAVSDAGGLPAIALGLRSAEELDQGLGRLKEVMGDRPYAVNFVALQENPHLEQQLEWIEKSHPPFAVIAAGEPSFATRLQEKGIQTLYIATSEGLIRLALKAGVRFVILEGNEAGGHVGEHSTLTLAQIALALKQKEAHLFQDRYLALAGGIFNRETAFRAAMMGADGVQMGTAYLATREIVSSGALNPLYQRLIIESLPGMTEVTGESVGLRVRSLRTPTMDAICTLEREYTAGRHDETSFRHHLEALSANSLLIAARGTEGPDGPVIDEETCMRKGQFMSGAISGALNHVRTLEEFHRELAEGPMELTFPALAVPSAPKAAQGAASQPEGQRVAITGMAVANSLGVSPEEVWGACLSGQSGISAVPLSRWDHSLFYDPDPRARGKTYCDVGAFMSIDISRKELGIAPQDFRSMADSTRLTLWLAEQAIQQSGILDAGIPRERIGVLVSQNSGESAATINDLVIDVNCHEIIDALRDFIPMTPDLEQAITEKIKAGRLRVDDTTLLGRLNCAAGGFICNKYGLQGPSHSVSAACASSLVALYNAIQMIKNGILDAAVVGGGEEYVHPSHFLEFSALKALARLSGRERLPRECSRPFDASRDGMVLGEGGGMIVVERESVAKRRGAPIHAYITGIGASNNDRGMVESLAEPQMIAIRASFGDAGYSPDQIDLVECHATSTVQGDIEEVKALKTLKSPATRTVLTSFKSQIGHTLGASGINSLIRGVTAMQAGVFPPTLNYQAPDPEIGLEAAGFHVPHQPEEWPEAAERPRRLQVNAFGFGGANYVVQLEGCRQSSGRVLVPMGRPKDSAMPVQTDQKNRRPVEGVAFLRGRLAGSPHRVGAVAPTDREAREKVEGLAAAEEQGPLSKKTLRRMARKGVFASPADTPKGSLAYVFTGQGSQYVGMGKELYEVFPGIRRWMDKISATADFDLLDLLFNSSEEDLQKTRWQQPALYTMEFSMVQELIAMGAPPAAMAGHSLGELVALAVAGVFSCEDGFGIVNTRALCMDKASELRGDPGTMVAVDAPLDYLEEQVEARDNVYFTNFNSPHQMVIGGDTAPVLALMEAIKKDGHRATQLKVSMAFHSPIMKVIHEEMAAYVEGIAFHPPKIPVISNTTKLPYPDDPDQIRRILMQHLETPVHWMQNVKTLWNDFGVRTFVEIGPKDTLCNMVGEILETSVCFPACMPETEANTFRRTVAQLYALGHLDHSGEDLGAPASRQSGPVSTDAYHPTPSLPGDRVGAIVQREINAFILDSFGKILKPQIVDTVRREVDPGFTQDHLERLLGQPGGAPPTTVTPTAPTAIPQAAPVLAAAPPAAPPVSQVVQPGETAEKIDYVEQTIRIIMDATGYDRDEIEPDMDIRQDLAIRSSRLPVIMDDIERQFNLTVNVEDFIDKRTVQEIADCIEMLAGKNKGGDSAGSSPAQPPPAPETEAPDATAVAPRVDDNSLKRLVLEEVELPASAPPAVLTLKPDQEVAVLQTQTGSGLAADLSIFIEETMGARIRRIDCTGAGDNAGFDLRTAEGARKTADLLEQSPALAGLVLVMDGEAQPPLSGPEEAAAFLTGFFRCLKSLTSSRSKTFCISLLRNVPPGTPEELAGEGVTGMFLAAAQEYPSLLFRSVGLDSDTAVDTALERALDTANPVIQMRYRQQAAFTLMSANAPLPLEDAPRLGLGAKDVVVITGGAQGVTYRIARALAPFKSRVVLLGRTELDTETAYDTLKNLDGSLDDALSRLKQKQERGDGPASGTDKNLAALDIARNVSRLSALGLKVSYRCCDVADSDKVTETLDGVVKQFGRIDGIIHGAGLIRDNFMEYMSPEDFEGVVAVKLLGAWNLFRAARDYGLRFFAGLSSIVAIQGNVGQVNYCAANRSMSALLRALPASQGDLVSKALMLPPIEGTGMADHADVKELMERKGLASAFVHADEFAQMFCRELFTGPTQPSWVMLARTFPAVKGTRVDAPEPPGEDIGFSAGGVCFRKTDLPMIDTVEDLDLRQGALLAHRTFSRDADLWIEDHKPFKQVKHPLVSAIMAVETFLEAAHLLYPHLAVLGVRRLVFEDILECPPGVDRNARITCRKEESPDQKTCCEATLTSADISPSGRPLDRWSTNYRGQVVLEPTSGPLPLLPDFDIDPGDLDTPPMTPAELQESYGAFTGLKGRYRVLDNILGTGSGIIKGEMVYREHVDMAGLEKVRYQYPPYLLESLMHLFAFYAVLRQDEGTADLIPAGMEEMRFTRRAADGERFALEARLRGQDEQGVTWDAQAVDESGTPVMQLLSMRMNRFGM